MKILNNMKKIFNIIISLVILAFLVVTLGFVESKHHKIRCNEVSVVIKNISNNYFIDKEEVFAIVTKNNVRLTGALYDSLNKAYIEKILGGHPAIKKADIYHDLKGKICIEVEQRIPIIRIINGDQSYYIDEDGFKMPVSRKYTSRAIIANGNISEKFALEELYPLAKFIWENKFWKSHIEQIWVDRTGDLGIVPRVGNHKIIFGDAKDFDDKLKKLKAMYDQAFNKLGWDKYKTINLKFKNQVICSK